MLSFDFHSPLPTSHFPPLPTFLHPPLEEPEPDRPAGGADARAHRSPAEPPFPLEPPLDAMVLRRAVSRRRVVSDRSVDGEGGVARLRRLDAEVHAVEVVSAERLIEGERQGTGDHQT